MCIDSFLDARDFELISMLEACCLINLFLRRMNEQCQKEMIDFDSIPKKLIKT